MTFSDAQAMILTVILTHGTAPNTKQPGIFRMMGESCNGFNNRIGGDTKIAKAHDIKEELDIVCLMYCEHRLIFWHKDNKINLKQMFQRESACTAISMNKLHEAKQAGMVQESGTGTICFGDCTDYIKKVVCNNKGLCRWSWILLGVSDGHNTCIIAADYICKNKNINSGTSYQQQQQYFITKKKELTCPLILFCKSLVKQLKQWRAAGDRIVLFMDHNKHVIKGNLGKVLADRGRLDLRKAILHHTGASPRASFF
jgi:hypothetical protein